MKIQAAGLSDVGQLREHNEDSFCISEAYSLSVVADGMGGHRAGDIASRMAVETITEFFAATDQEDATWPFQIDPHLTVEENRLVTGIKLANQRIFDASVRHQEVNGMGTTVVCALYVPSRNRMYLAHVGDSRAYRIRQNSILQLTRDHSLVNDYLLMMPDMTDSQREELPTNVITRALGMQDSVLVDIVPEEPQAGDYYLLCSDGLNGMVSDRNLRDLVLGSQGDLESAVSTLVEAANEAGGEDNITAVLLKLSD